VGVVASVTVAAVVFSLPIAVGASAARKPRPVVVLTNYDASTALLRVPELPSGYSELPGAPTVAVTTGGFCNRGTDLAQAQSAKVGGFAGVAYAIDSYVGPFLDEVVYSFPSVPGAETFLVSLRKLGRCPALHDETIYGPRTMSITEDAFGKIADEVVALRETDTAETPETLQTDSGQRTVEAGVLYTYDRVAVRVGNDVITLTHGGLDGNDVAFEQQVLEQAVTKLKSTIRTVRTTRAATTTTRKKR